jgi:1-deoxy-D-xylulose-5-phosphate reductoisomerase
VDAFLQGKVGFLDIPRIIRSVVERHTSGAASSLEQILSADSWARQTAHVVICEIQGASYS